MLITDNDIIPFSFFAQILVPHRYIDYHNVNLPKSPRLRLVVVSGRCLLIINIF